MTVGRPIWRAWGLALAVVLLVALVPGTASAARPWIERRLTTEHWYGAADSAVDAAGRVHMAVRRNGDGFGVRYLRPRGDGTWDEMQVARDPMSRAVAIALDPAGQPLIAWTHGTRAIRIATLGTDGWTVDRLVQPDIVPEGIDLAVGADGAVHLSWFRDVYPAAHLRYATDRGGHWTVRDLGRADAYASTSVAVDAQGVAYLAAAVLRSPRSSTLRVRVYRLDANGVTVSPELGEGNDPSLTLDGTGRPMVAWQGYQGIHVAWYRGGSWHRRVHPGAPLDLWGIGARGGRPVIAGDWDLPDGRLEPAIAELQPDGTWRDHVVGRAGWACQPVGVHPVGRIRVLLPCSSTQDMVSGVVPPGLGVGELDADGYTVRSVATEERYREAHVAHGPDGHLEVLTVATDRRLMLHRQVADGWRHLPLPVTLDEAVSDFAIGPSGDRAIVGATRGGGVTLLADRSGSWVTTQVGTGLGSMAQVAIDAAGRYHVGYARQGASSRYHLWLAVGTPGTWRRTEVPMSVSRPPMSEDFIEPWFMTAADGTDAVAWRRNLRKAGDGILLATRDEGGWSVDRLGRGDRAELWDAAMAPDGSVGLLRGSLLYNTLQTIRDGRRDSERVPGVFFLGGILAYDGASRPGVLGIRWDLHRLWLTRRTPSGWTRRLAVEGRWDDVDLAFDAQGPAVLVGRHLASRDTAGYYVASPAH